MLGRGEVIEWADASLSFRPVHGNTDGKMVIHMGDSSQFIALVTNEVVLESAMATWFTARPDSLERVLNEIEKGGEK